jgi:hypothetical protein
MKYIFELTAIALLIYIIFIKPRRIVVEHRYIDKDKDNKKDKKRRSDDDYIDYEEVR